MPEESEEKLEQTSENTGSADTPTVPESSGDAKGLKGKLKKRPVTTKTKEIIEIIIVVAILMFVFKLKSQGALDNPVGVLGNVLGF